MKRTAAALLTLTLLAGVMPTAEAATTPMRFGMDAYSLQAQTDAGVKPDYGTIWVGPWTMDNWGSVDKQMANMKSKGITPAIHLYYWGDDISKSCIKNGCWSDLHGVHKDQAGWNRLTRQLINHMEQQMGGATTYVILESEFNKGDVQYFEPLDYRLMKKAQQIESGYPAAKTVLGLGNWNPGAWGTWDRAAGAADFIGIQGMRGSTQDTVKEYRSLYESTLLGAQKAQAKFGKRIVITDIALSSYPSGDYEWRQGAELQEFFAGMGALKAAGVKVMIYRSWKDSNMDTANYYGQAERHWGLTRGDGGWKAAATVWTKGVQAERGAVSSGSGGSGGFDASFRPADTTNNWWVDVKVGSDKNVVKVDAIVDGKATPLSKTSWGTWAKSTHIPDGAQVKFRATSGSGATDTSKVYTWS